MATNPINSLTWEAGVKCLLIHSLRLCRHVGLKGQGGQGATMQQKVDCIQWKMPDTVPGGSGSESKYLHGDFLLPPPSLPLPSPPPPLPPSPLILSATSFSIWLWVNIRISRPFLSVDKKEACGMKP